jgi:uracil-DNA glycosylase
MENIHSSWGPLFKNYNIDLDTIYKDCNDIYPKDKRDTFKVFKMNVEDIRTVLLGQDPYYANEHQAHGLSFSVPEYIKIPPSLKNIFKEIELEFPERKYNFINGNLTKWFQDENIFLLNCSLTVKKSKPNSHMNIWKKFTDDVIKFINEKNKNCVYLLLGNFAHNKIKLINEDQHKMVINAVHPSPLSAYKGFFNSGIFKQVEILLEKEVNWQN